MPTPESALQAPVGQYVGFGDHPRQTHRIFKGQSVQSSAKPNSVSALRGRCEHGKRIGGNRKLLEEMMVNDRVHVETDVIGVLDLMHDLPDHVVMRLTGRSLNFAI